MKKIKLVIVNEFEDKNYNEPWFTKPYQGCYKFLAFLADREKLDVYKTSFVYWNNYKHYFVFSWHYLKDKWVRSFKQIVPDVVYYKGIVNAEQLENLRHIQEYSALVNSNEFIRIFEDKFLAYTFFPEFFPKTFSINNRKNILTYLKEIKTSKVVLKPCIGSGGFGIKILAKSQARKFIPKEPMIMQEFVDTSRGYKNLIKGVYDLRMFVINDKISYAYFRSAKKDSLLSNIHQGGTMTNIKNNQIPFSIKQVITKLNKKFKFFGPRIFSVDFFFSQKGKPLIVEFNTRPGIYFYPSDRKLQTRVYLEMITLFKEAAKNR